MAQRSASKRVPRRAAWMPTHSAVKWSTAMKIVAGPSSVQPAVASIPHMASGRSGMIVPSCAVGPWGWPRPRRGQQARLAHQPEDARLAGPDPGQAQPRPHLAVALADKRRAAPARHGSARSARRPSTPSSARASEPRRRQPSRPRGVDGRARDLQHPAHPSQTVAAIHGGRSRLAHHLDLLRPKGGPPPPGAPAPAAARSPSSARRSSPADAPARRRARRPRLFTAACPPARTAPPLRDRPGCHPQLATQRVEILATQHPQHDLRLPPRRPPSPLAAYPRSSLIAPSSGEGNGEGYPFDRWILTEPVDLSAAVWNASGACSSGNVFVTICSTGARPLAINSMATS